MSIERCQTSAHERNEARENQGNRFDGRTVQLQSAYLAIHSFLDPGALDWVPLPGRWTYKAQ